MYQLGGQALFLSNRDLQIGRGEPVEDTARVLSRYLDGIMIRTFEQKEVEDLAKYGSIPIINGLTDYCHPCQVLADLMTIREYKKSFDGLKFCFIGDGNNMANSLIVGAITMGMSCAIACPDEYKPDAEIMKCTRKTATLCVQATFLNVQKTQIFFTPTFGLQWVKKKKRQKEKRYLRITKLMMRLWKLPRTTPWFFTAFLLTEKRKSQPKYLKNTQTKSLTKRKTDFTLKRQFSLNC